MNTQRARDISTRVMSMQFVQDGLDESGNEVDAPSDVLAAYDYSIRNGDIPYINWMISTYGHSDVPILRTDPLYMLDHASHEALLWLDENEYITLPDIVRAIIYDDPFLLHPRDITKEVVIRILSRGAWEIFLEYRYDIINVISSASECKMFMRILASTSKDEGVKHDIVQELLKERNIQTI